jgi:hypothetical protein
LLAYMFRSGKDIRRCALSTDKSGGNLPPEFCPWLESSELTLLRARQVLEGDSRDVEALQRQGYYLFRVA